MRMPNKCHWCRQEFPVDVQAVIEHLHARIHNFRTGRTWPVRYYKESKDVQTVGTE